MAQMHLTQAKATPSTNYDSDEEPDDRISTGTASTLMSKHTRTDSRQPLLLPIAISSANPSVVQPSPSSRFFTAAKDLWQSNFGFLLVVGASLFFSVINVLVAMFSTSKESIRESDQDKGNRLC